MTTLASDNFTRSNQSGWGTASDGNTWNHLNGSGTLAISSNTGTMNGAFSMDTMAIGSGTSADTEVLAKFTFTQSNNGLFAVIRSGSTGQNCYLMGMGIDFGSGFVEIAKLVSNSTTDLGHASFSITAGSSYWIRAQAIGTALKVRIWLDGSSEPGTWNVSITDSTYTAAGRYGVGFSLRASGDTPSISSLTVTDASTGTTANLTDVVLSLSDVSTTTEVFVPTDSQTTSDSLGYWSYLFDTSTLNDASTETEVFVPTETLTETETNLETVAFAPTDTALSSSETNLETVVFVPTDSLTSSETNLETVAFVPTDIALSSSETDLETVVFVPTDTLTTSDGVAGETYLPDSVTSSETNLETVVFVPTDSVTSSETNLETVVFVPTDTALTSSDTLVSTNPVLLTDEVLTSTETGNFILAYAATDTATEVDASTTTEVFTPTDTLAMGTDGIAGETYIPDSLTVVDGIAAETYLPDTLTSDDSASSETEVFIPIDTLTSSDIFSFSTSTSGSNITGTDSLTLSDSISFVYVYVLTDTLTLSDTFSSSNAFASYPYLGWDTFTRANQSGWGTASDGQTWSTTTGSPTLSIASNEGTATSISSLNFMRLGSKTSTDQSGLIRVSASSTNFLSVGICLRMTATNTTYRVRINTSTPATGFAIVKTVTGTTTNIVTSSFTASTNTFYWIRAAVIGSNLYGKVWQSGTAEPAAWTLTTTDSSITGAGGFGVVCQSNTGTDTASFDSFFVVDYALGDYSVYPLDNVIDSEALSITDTATLTDASKTTDVPVLSDTLTSVETFSTTEVFTTTESFTEVELRAYTVAVNFVDAALTFTEAISTIARSTVSNIEGTDTVTSDSTASSYAEVFVPIDSITSTDIFSFSYTYNNPYTGTSTVASDTYDRSNQSGWGTASDGATWSVASGTLTYAISSNQGTISGTSGTGVTFLGTESTLDGEAQITFQIKNNTSDSFGLCLRAADASNYYYTYYNNNTLFIKKNVSGTVTSLASTSFTGGTSNFYHIRFVVQGSNLFSRIWQDGTAEGASWTVVTTDSALSSSGKTGVYTVSTTSGTITVDNYLVVDYRLADLSSLVDATTFTEAHADSDTGTTVDSTAATFVYAVTDAPAQVELSLFLEAYAATDTASTSDTTTPTPVFVPVDVLTSTESEAYVLTENNVDSVVLDDESSLFLYVPIDTLTSVELLLGILALSLSNTDTTSDTILPTLVRNITDDAVSSSEIDLNTVVQFSDLSAIDTLVFTDIYSTTLTQLESTVFTFSEVLNNAFSLIYPVDTITENEQYTTVVNYHQNAVVNTLAETQFNALLENLLDTATTQQELYTFILSQFMVYAIPFAIDASTTTIIQKETNTFTEQETVAYALAMLEAQLFALIDASTTTVIQLESEAQSVGASTYFTAEDFVPVDTLNNVETLTQALFFSWLESSTQVEQYLTTLAVPQTDTLSVGTELVAEVLKFGPTETLTALETLLSVFAQSYTETLTTSELDAIVIVQFESTQFTETENATYALFSSYSETLSVPDVLLAILSYSTTLSQTLAEQTVYALVQQEINIFAFTETLLVSLSENIQDAVFTTLDNFSTVLSSLLIDNSVTSETIIESIATTFTNWVDTLIEGEVGSFVFTYQPVDTTSLHDISFLSQQSTLVDTASAQELLTVSEIYSATDHTQATDTFLSTFTLIFSDILGIVENSAWQGLFAEIEGVTSTDILAMQLALSKIDTNNIGEVPTFIVVPFFTTTVLVLSETTSKALIFLLTDLLTSQEVLRILAALTLLDTVLTPIELAPALGYALFDVVVISSDVIDYSNYIFMNVLALVRSGAISGTTRSGSVTSTTRSGKVNGVTR